MSNIIDHPSAATAPAARIALNDSLDIPILGFGTANIGDYEANATAVSTALQAGYRHIDTAQMYHNEEGVGEGIRRSGVSRDTIFVTTKLDNHLHSYQAAIDSLDESLQRLRLDYVDLFLIHWPEPESDGDRWAEANREAWRAMMDLRDAGKIRSIGVSNFHPHHLDALIADGGDVPTVNQIKLGPGHLQEHIVRDCRERQIVLTAYSPLGKARGFDHPVVHQLAEQHGKSPAQIALRWSLQMGFIPLPRSSNPQRIQENADLFDFQLAPDAMNELTTLTGFMN